MHLLLEKDKCAEEEEYIEIPCQRKLPMAGRQLKEGTMEGSFGAQRLNESKVLRSGSRYRT